MKAKLNSLIAIVVLGLIGLGNINATVDHEAEKPIVVTADADKELTVETWMIDESYWDNEKAEIVATADSTDEPLTVENWMVNTTIWK
jgi:Zn-dependent alcohol dehydrogenase